MRNDEIVLITWNLCALKEEWWSINDSSLQWSFLLLLFLWLVSPSSLFFSLSVSILNIIYTKILPAPRFISFSSGEFSWIYRFCRNHFNIFYMLVLSPPFILYKTVHHQNRLHLYCYCCLVCVCACASSNQSSRWLNHWGLISICVQWIAYRSQA